MPFSKTGACENAPPPLCCPAVHWTAPVRASNDTSCPPTCVANTLPLPPPAETPPNPGWLASSSVPRPRADPPRPRARSRPRACPPRGSLTRVGSADTSSSTQEATNASRRSWHRAGRGRPRPKHATGDDTSRAARHAGPDAGAANCTARRRRGAPSPARPAVAPPWTPPGSPPRSRISSRATLLAARRATLARSLADGRQARSSGHASPPTSHQAVQGRISQAASDSSPRSTAARPTVRASPRTAPCGSRRR